MPDVVVKVKTFQDWLNTSRQDLIDHTEVFAAAFLKYTNMPPDKVVMMVEQRIVDNKIQQVIWFEEKKEGESHG